MKNQTNQSSNIIMSQSRPSPILMTENMQSLNSFANCKFGAKLQSDEEKKKHNACENRRRQRLRAKFLELREVAQSAKKDRCSILEEAINKIQGLFARVHQLEQQHGFPHFFQSGPSASTQSPQIKREHGTPTRSHFANPRNEKMEYTLDSPIASYPILNYIATAFISLDGRFKDANQLFLELMHYSREELLQSTVFTLTHPSDLLPTFASVKRLLAGECTSWESDKRWIARNGCLVPVHLTMVVVKNKSLLPHFFICFAVSKSYVAPPAMDLATLENMQSSLSNVGLDSQNTRPPPPPGPVPGLTGAGNGLGRVYTPDLPGLVLPGHNSRPNSLSIFQQAPQSNVPARHVGNQPQHQLPFPLTPNSVDSPQFPPIPNLNRSDNNSINSHPNAHGNSNTQSNVPNVPPLNAHPNPPLPNAFTKYPDRIPSLDVNNNIVPTITGGNTALKNESDIQPLPPLTHIKTENIITGDSRDGNHSQSSAPIVGVSLVSNNNMVPPPPPIPIVGKRKRPS